MAQKSKRLMKSRRGRQGQRVALRRRTKRHTAVGRMFPPVDVRNKGALGEALKRIKAGPITIMLVYADWCGHCKDFKPHFDAASRSADRTVQAVKVNDAAFPAVNAALTGMNGNTNGLSVEAYPTVLLLDNKGNQITEVNAVKDTGVMKKVMKEAGQNAEEVSLSSPKPPSESAAPKNVGSLMNSASTARRASGSLPTDPTMNEIRSLPAVVSTRSESANEAAANIVEPPVDGDDIIRNSEGAVMKGGSLYGSLAATTYRLAPAAVLLGLAAATTMRGKRGRGRGRGRKTLRRRGRK